MREKIGVFLVILFISVVAFADSPYTNKPISPPEGSTNITTLGTVTTGTWNATKIGIEYGGTNATNATDARTNLGLGTLATQNADNAAITGGTIDGATIGGTTPAPGSFTDLTVSGAVNATSSTWTGLSANTTGNAATATSLAANPTDCAANTVATAIDATGNLTCGYALNADIQAYDADLDTWAGITPSTDMQAFLGATNATDARTNLGLAIGSDVQAYDADLDTWAGISPSTDMQAFLGAANDTAARTELGLGTLATQNADNASVTNLTVGGFANVTGTVTAGTISANVIKTDTSADATLSGTPIIITVYDAATNTPYYFKAYPTK